MVSAILILLPNSEHFIAKRFRFNPKSLRIVLGIFCGLILLVILGAGLWPFRSPKNDLTWLTKGNGVHLGHCGTILSSGKFQTTSASADAALSVEIWAVPDLTRDFGTLFAFYIPAIPRQFSMEQSLSDLVLRNERTLTRYKTRTAPLYVHNIFYRGKPVFITITSNEKLLLVYIDGTLAHTSRHFGLSARDLEGQLVLNNSPMENNSWSGILRGLAIYRQALTPEQVVQHFEAWTGTGNPNISGSERPWAVYLFNEHGGRVIHSQVSPAIDLYIPEHFQVVDKILLKPFWQEYDPSWGYWQDVLVNIAGFVPFGLIFCMWLSFLGRIKRPALLTIFLGFLVSLAIESLQSLLPTRGSSTTDLINNTLGTCLGVWLYRGLRLADLIPGQGTQRFGVVKEGEQRKRQPYGHRSLK